MSFIYKEMKIRGVGANPIDRVLRRVKALLKKIEDEAVDDGQKEQVEKPGDRYPTRRDYVLDDS